MAITVTLQDYPTGNFDAVAQAVNRFRRELQRKLCDDADADLLDVMKASANRTMGRASGICLIAFAISGSLSWISTAQAQESPRAQWYVQAGTGDDSARAAGVGVTLSWPQSWRWTLGSGHLSGHWDLSLTGWSGRPVSGAERSGLGVLGAGGAVRWRAKEGRSPWFVEVGTGLSLASRHYTRDGQRFSTRYNFASHVGAGYLFGEDGQHEISVRLQHTSNAHIKEPNPGANFLLLRYARAF